MTISIGSNLAALGVNRQLSKTSKQLQSTFERLSSGQRINRAGDDSAGLAIAQSLAASTRIAQVAIRNANDGVSLISLADGALAEIGNILAQQAELAAQAANGVYSVQQRSALQIEFSSLGAEVERIALTTQFNGINLLSGTSTTVFQVGLDATSLSQITLNGVQGTLQALGLAASGTSTLSYSINAASVDDGQSAARLALTAVNGAIGSLATARGALGAVQGRLEASVNNLSVLRENFSAAESRIRDVDIAEEATNFTRLMILQQVGVSILAQANQIPQMALQLLK